MNNTEVFEDKQSQASNDVRRFSKDTITYGIAIIIPALIGIISISIYTRLFSAEEYGEYNQVFNTAVVITTLFSQWIQQSIQRYRPLYRSDNKLGEFNKNLTNLLFMMFLLIIFIGCIGSFFKGWLGRYEPYYWISMLLILTQFSFLILATLLQADFKSRVYKNYNLLTSILKFGLGIVLILYVNKHPISIIYGLVLGQIILLSSMFKNAGLSLQLLQIQNWKETIQFTKKFMVYGFPMIGWFIGTSILNLADRYMLELLGDIKDVGIYSANFAIVSASLGLLTTPLLTAAHPIIMNQAGNSTEAVIEKTISFFVRIYMLVSIPLLAFITIFHREIATIFLGKDFREGSIIVPILFLGILLWNLAMYGQKGYEIKEKTSIMLIFILISSTVNVILNFIFIPIYGYKGAALATLISMAVYPVLIKIFSFKYIKWKIDILSTIRIIISSTVAALTVNFLKDTLIHHTLFQIMLGGLIGLLIYVCLLFVSKEVNYLDTKEKIMMKLMNR